MWSLRNVLHAELSSVSSGGSGKRTSALEGGNIFEMEGLGVAC